VTARRSVTRFLNTLDSDYKTFFDAESDVMIVLDAAGNVERVNLAFTRVLDRNERDVLGQPIAALVCIDDLAKFFRAFEMAGSEKFRLLRRGSGAVEMLLIAFRFKRVDDDQGRRGFLILRPIRLVDD
jgi:PAS domain-containing protein